MTEVVRAKQVRQWLLKSLGLLLLTLVFNHIAVKLGTRIDKMVEELWRLATKEGLVVDLWYTARRFGLGYLLAFVTAIPIGIVVGRVRSVASVLDIPIELLRPIPSAVVIPLGLAFLGIGECMKIFVVWFGAFWPMLVFVRQACKHLDPVLLETAQVFHQSRLRTLCTIVMPAIVPSILGAARTALAIALLLAVTVEMIAGGDPNGLGYFIIDSERSFQSGQMLVGVVVLAIFGYAINGVFSILEKVVKKRRYAYYERMVEDTDV